MEATAPTRLVVSDWDRTLAPPPGNKISKRTVLALSDLPNRGVIFALASGRPAAGVVNLAKRNGVDLNGAYVIGFNGGSVSRAEEPDRYLWSAALAGPVVSVTAAFADRHGMEFLIPTSAAVYTTKVDGHFTGVETASTGLPALPLRSWDPQSTPALKAELITSGMDDAGALRLLRADLEAAGCNVDLELAAPGQLQLNAPGINKGVALGVLCAHLGVDSSQVLAFGDNHNDVSLLRAAGRGYAVENAVPELLRAADEVVGRCEDDGVAVKLELLTRFAR